MDQKRGCRRPSSPWRASCWAGPWVSPRAAGTSRRRATAPCRSRRPPYVSPSAARDRTERSLVEAFGLPRDTPTSPSCSWARTADRLNIDAAIAACPGPPPAGAVDRLGERVRAAFCPGRASPARRSTRIRRRGDAGGVPVVGAAAAPSRSPPTPPSSSTPDDPAALAATLARHHRHGWRHLVAAGRAQRLVVECRRLHRLYGDRHGRPP